MDKDQQERFQEALERKDEEAQRRAETSNPHGPDGDADAASAEAHERQLIADDRPQDTFSVRDKNAGKGKKTADKWNQ